jgi:hypothetical protein
MKKISNIIRKTALTGAFVGVSAMLFAGNEDRVGSSGASELLINPWARSLAWGDAGVACVNGLEATFTNIAGLAFTGKTEIKFNYTRWMGDAGININSAGIAQRISEKDVLSVSVMAMSFGDIQITTEDLPEGGIGSFSPRYMNFNIGYAREFSSHISGGLGIKVITQNIANLKAIGFGIDAGIRYTAGKKDQMKFGIALKNVGPKMKFRGDGLAYQVDYGSTGASATLEQRTAQFELPSLLNIGMSYDFLFGLKKEGYEDLKVKNKLTVAAAFTANSFSNDQYKLGLSYNLKAEKAAFNLSAGYVFEKDIFNAEVRTNSLTGFTAGASVDVLLGKKKTALGIEYAMRLSNPFGVIHTFGATIALN